MSDVGEFYVVASRDMRPMEAIGPLPDRETALRVVTVMQATKLRYPLTIATRRPMGIPIMSGGRFIVELDQAMARARTKKEAREA